MNAADLFDAPAGETLSAVLDHNLYWNGGDAIPEDAGQALRFSDDVNALVADPQLAEQTSLVAPVWNGSGFADGSSAIGDAFAALVNQFGAPAAGSLAVDNADPDRAAPEDILGQQRGPLPDLGAFETNPLNDTLFADGFEPEA